MTTAEDIMTTDVKTVSETTSLRAALELMQDGSIRHLPVVRDESLVGILSDRDIQALGLRLVTDLESLERLEANLTVTVGSVMSGDVLAVNGVADITEILDLFVGEKIGAVPVVNEGKLVGIISYVDVLRALRDELA